MIFDLIYPTFPSRIAKRLFGAHMRRTQTMQQTSYLALQRYDEQLQNWCTVRKLSCGESCGESYERTYAELERQQSLWESNYLPFFGSKWRTIPTS